MQQVEGIGKGRRVWDYLSMSIEWIEFKGHRVRLRRRAFQRSLKLHVQPSGELLVTSGLSLPLRVIHDFLAQSWDWVEKSKARLEALRADLPVVRFCQGDRILFVGEEKRLEFTRGLSSLRQVRLEGDALVALVPPKEWALFHAGAAHPDWQPVIRRFYEAQGRALLTERVQKYAMEMNLWPRSLSFRCQRTRWGSCTQHGAISLNWRLVAAPLRVMDYVVIHELAHLEHLNHSRAFWRRVEEFCPDFREPQSWLKRNHQAFDFLLAHARP